MTGIILAAGQGIRLKPYTEDRTKGLVEAGGRPLFDYVINFLRNLKVDSIIIIGGFQAEKVKKYIHVHAPDIIFLKINTLTKGNLKTLLTALPHINDSFLLLNSDHIYRHTISKCVLEQLSGITAFCDTDRTLQEDDMKVFANNNTVKEISKTLARFTHGYVGMTYVDKSAIPFYRKTAYELDAKSDGSIAVEAILAELAKNNYSINIGDISGYGWLEIDNEKELLCADNILRSNAHHFLK